MFHVSRTLHCLIALRVFFCHILFWPLAFAIRCVDLDLALSFLFAAAVGCHMKQWLLATCMGALDFLLGRRSGIPCRAYCQNMFVMG
jgi:hypothetical protein